MGYSINNCTSAIKSVFYCIPYCQSITEKQLEQDLENASQNVNSANKQISNRQLTFRVNKKCLSVLKNTCLGALIGGIIFIIVTVQMDGNIFILEQNSEDEHQQVMIETQQKIMIYFGFSFILMGALIGGVSKRVCR